MKPEIFVLASDAERLENIADRLPASAVDCKNALLDELARADIVEADQLPARVVTMNSSVRFEVSEPREEFCLTLVYPADLNTAPNQISVLTPMGTALLGMAEGNTIEWPRRDGQAVQVRVLEVLSQWNGQACLRAAQ
ncbi:nucleoside diphosphate kinase regulator [Massilia sp. RP-1-19]|uniref:Nucleoside diphosphate kinase regulator n=1 Tax=Massilia polaris TaxID=2728846 RepID=A0A848HI85_9BURK|nr:nucleoside diphosphate kinase regulator [Massilia polaris]NML59869.1 nucleoside diphosphate kinase regulator [Massilia polaris]